MSKVKVKIQVKTSKRAIFRLLLDGKKVPVEDGEAVIELVARNEEYVLSWFINDVPGAKYSVKVTEPEKIKMNYEVTIDETGKHSELYPFKILE
jgi:hypothetical protein